MVSKTRMTHTAISMVKSFQYTTWRSSRSKSAFEYNIYQKLFKCSLIPLQFSHIGYHGIIMLYRHSRNYNKCQIRIKDGMVKQWMTSQHLLSYLTRKTENNIPSEVYQLKKPSTLNLGVVSYEKPRNLKKSHLSQHTNKTSMMIILHIEIAVDVSGSNPMIKVSMGTKIASPPTSPKTTANNPMIYSTLE